jgi:Family of unknown function (DUF6221)
VPNDFDYLAFLTARLNEQEHRWTAKKFLSEKLFHFTLGEYAKYMLADVTAKRAILAEYRKLVKEADKWADRESETAQALNDEATGVHTSIENLCRTFADHSDYPGDKDSNVR